MSKTTKIILWAALAFALAFSARAQQITAYWNYSNMIGSAAPSVVKAEIAPLYPLPLNLNGHYCFPNTNVFQPATTPSMTNGWIQTNLWPGETYRFSIWGPMGQFSTTNSFPVALTNSGTNLVDASIYDDAGMDYVTNFGYVSAVLAGNGVTVSNSTNGGAIQATIAVVGGQATNVPTVSSSNDTVAISQSTNNSGAVNYDLSVSNGGGSGTLTNVTATNVNGSATGLAAVVSGASAALTMTNNTNVATPAQVNAVSNWTATNSITPAQLTTTSNGLVTDISTAITALGPVVTNNETGVTLSGTFAGTGSNLAGLQASNMTGPTNYLYACFLVGDTNLSLLASVDCSNFNILTGGGIYYDTNIYGGGGVQLRDPSIIRWRDGVYYICYTVDYPYAGGNWFNIASSPTLGVWSYAASVTNTNTPAGWCWAPEWFVDPNSTNLYIFSAANTNTGTLDHQSIYICHSLDGTPTNMSTLTKITGFPTNLNTIDPYCVWNNGVYNLWFTDGNYIQYGTSTNVAGPYTLVASNDWAGWGGTHEADSVIYLGGGRWRVFMYSKTVNLMQFSDSTNNWTNWSSLFTITNPAFTHGTVLALTDQTSLDNIALLQASRTNQYWGGLTVNGPVSAIGANGNIAASAMVSAASFTTIGTGASTFAQTILGLNSSGTNLTIYGNSPAASKPPLIVVAGVFSNLVAFENSNGTAVANVDANGNVFAASFTGSLAGGTGLPPSGLQATNSPTSSTFYRGDGSWQPASGGSNVTSVAVTNVNGSTAGLFGEISGTALGLTQTNNTNVVAGVNGTEYGALSVTNPTMPQIDIEYPYGTFGYLNFLCGGTNIGQIKAGSAGLQIGWNGAYVVIDNGNVTVNDALYIAGNTTNAGNLEVTNGAFQLLTTNWGYIVTSNGVTMSYESNGVLYAVNGLGSTPLNASQLTTGTVSLAVLPSAVITNHESVLNNAVIGQVTFGSGWNVDGAGDGGFVNLLLTGAETNDSLTASQYVATDANKKLISTVNGTNWTNIPAGQLTGSLPAISGASLTGLPAVTNSINVPLTYTGATILINGANFSNSAIGMTFKCYVTNLATVVLTNWAEGAAFAVTFYQGAGLTNALSYDATTNGVTIWPTVTNQFISLPTNSTNAHLQDVFQISNNGTNADLWQTPFVR